MPFGPRLLQIPGSPAGGNNRPVPAASMFSTPADLADALSGSVQVPSRSPDQATEGVDVLQTALTRDRLGEFQAQAAIAALHADARTAEETDWVQIVEWYDELYASPPARWPASTGPSRSARPTARRPAWPPWRGSTPPCPATPPSRRTYTSVTVTQSPQHGSTPKLPDRRPASPNATTSRDRPHGSTRSCAVERRAAGIHRPDRDGLLTLLAGRTASLAVQEADIPCSSLLTSDHRKRNPLRTPGAETSRQP